MALPSTIYRTNIQISDIDHEIYETVQATVAQHPSETIERVVARLLAMAIFYEPELIFTKGISATDEPDIWVIGPDGRTLLWVEVGLPESARIVKASRHAERIALLVCGKTLSSWEQQHLAKLRSIKNLTIISVDQALINALASNLERVINWSITITEGTIYLTSGEVTYTSAIQIKAGTM